ncbi:MAG: octaprenyl diphosphate synthase [Gammaproteobacteria bacterium]|nr:octaprenyl diphosphate synthase [Gammaproteobacteria bacterium]
MLLKEIQSLIATDRSAVDAMIRSRLKSDVVLVNQLGHYIIGNGGKRLRPQIVLLAAAAAGYKGDWQINLAAIIEFIHTATLLHDDVVDASELRRGRDTSNAIWGNEAAVLVGDFLYSRSFEMMVEVGSLRVMEILSQTTNIIAEGEVMQLLNVHEPDTTEETYLEVIHCKTAKLFEAAALLGGVLAEVPQEQEEALARYGMHLGTAFQLIDDVLDYSSSSEEMGKNVGDDLAEGKPTLPLILTMRNGTAEQTALIRKAIEEGGREMINEVMLAVQATGALEETREFAQREADLAIAALSCFPLTPHRTAMESLARFSVSRTT